MRRRRHPAPTQRSSDAESYKPVHELLGCVCALPYVIGTYFFTASSLTWHRHRPILLKNSKMRSPQFLAKLNRSCELLPRIAGSSVRTILVAGNTKSRLPPRPRLNEVPEDLQSFERLRKRGFSTE